MGLLNYLPQLNWASKGPTVPFKGNISPQITGPNPAPTLPPSIGRGWLGPGSDATTSGRSLATGAGNGPGPGTGQLGTNPFNNIFNFTIPTSNMSADSGLSTVTPPPGSTGAGGVTSGMGGGINTYIPLIIVGVVVAGIAYYAFERKK